MSDDDDTAAAATRLEHALERIALLARRTPEPSTAQTPGRSAGVDTAMLAARLDTLIARLRVALA